MSFCPSSGFIVCPLPMFINERTNSGIIVCMANGIITELATPFGLIRLFGGPGGETLRDQQEVTNNFMREFVWKLQKINLEMYEHKSYIERYEVVSINDVKLPEFSNFMPFKESLNDKENLKKQFNELSSGKNSFL